MGGDVQAEDGCTALDYAATRGHRAMAELLTRHGMDVYAKAVEKMTMRDMTCP